MEGPFPSTVEGEWMRFLRDLGRDGFFAVLILSASLSALRAEDTEELKATFDSALEALGNKQLDTFLGYWHREAVLFTRNRVHPIDRGQLDDREWAQLFEDFFGRVISVGYTQRAVRFRVIGDTGLVWGLTRFAVDTRGGDGLDQESRLTAVFCRVDGDWKIALWNDAPRPTERPPN